MPVGGSLCAAPLRELRIPQRPSHVIYQRKMTDQHSWDVRVTGLEAKLRLPYSRMTPRLPARVWVRVQHELIAAHDPCFVGSRERLLLRSGDEMTKRVVVEEEQRGDRHWTSGPLPNRIGILRRKHPN